MSEDQSSTSSVTFLAHRVGDHVAVAVRNVEPGPASVVYLENDTDQALTVLENVPLGHKVALVDLAADEAVVEYAVQIAVTRVPIVRGQLVHTHNIRSARWQNSVA